jgi:hypothetical protein
MNKKQVLIGLLFLLLLGPVGSSHAALIFTENFNTAVGVGSIYTDAPYSEKWSNTNYYIGGAPTNTGWTFDGQAYLAQNVNDLTDRAILLNESPNASMSRSIGGFTAGTTYLLSFDHWGDNRPETTAYRFSVGITGSPTSTISRTYTLDGTGATESIYFTATSNNNIILSFLDRSTGQASPIIDNISISSVPIPGALLLFAPCLAGLAILRKRLKKLG